MLINFLKREAFVGIDFNHLAKELLTLGRHIGRYLEMSLLDLLQQLLEIVVVEWQRAHQ